MKMKQTQYDVLKPYVIRYLSDIDQLEKRPDQSEHDFFYQIYVSTMHYCDIKWFNGVLLSYLTRSEVADVIKQIVYEHMKRSTNIILTQPIVEICTKQLRTKPPADPYGY